MAGPAAQAHRSRHRIIFPVGPKALDLQSSNWTMICLQERLLNVRFRRDVIVHAERRGLKIFGASQLLPFSRVRQTVLNRASKDELKYVKYFSAPEDGRAIAIFIASQFNEFDKFPPFMESEAEIRHVKEAYKIGDPLLERTTKAHITDDSWPLQIIILERNPGGTTLPHYHIPTEVLPVLPTRHQILICQKGKARVKIFTRQGQALGEVFLSSNDVVLLLEGHEVEFVEPGTRLIEIKQGPFPGTDADDKVDLKVPAR